ncbi:MAG: ABC transporter substrate-binding protein [Rubellimicrobium sp.]|nr:ABC transporter substrate-binding protein [Rubellimicrobium sp.]
MQMNLFNISRRRFMGSSAAAGLVTASSLVPLAARAEGPKRGGHLKIGLSGGASTDSLDAGTYSGAILFTIGKTFGDNLVESHPTTGEPVPALAESWEADASGTEWTFHIRKGVRFHDGTEMTVADCAQTIRRHADPESKSGALGLLGGIARIEERGDDLVIGLTEANADLPLVFSDYHLIVEPNGGLDNPTAGIGTGPYRLTEYEAGVRAAFVRNEDDWNPDRGFVDSVEIFTINDNTARIAALTSGQIHICDQVDPMLVDLLQTNPGVTVMRSPGKGFYCFLAHCNTAPFDNNDLRTALKFAIDRQEILDKVLGGFGTLGDDYPVNAAYALAPDDIEPRPFDPDQAAFYYRKSGHEGPLVLRTADAAFPGAVDAAVLYQSQAALAGIDIQVQREPDDGYWSDVWNVQPFSASYWGGRPTQDSRYATNFVSSAEWNDTRFFNPAFDAIVAQAKGELDTDRRRALYRDAALIVRNEGGLILPVFNDYLDAYASNIGGMIEDISNGTSGGYAASRVWFED